MSKSSIVASLAVALLLGLAGCASISSDAEEPTSTPNVVPTPAQEEPAATASVERWAGLVAERKLDTEGWFDDWNDALCSGLSSAAPDCNIMLSSASFIARTNDIVIAGASNPAGNTYLGEVPAEIADLYAETISLTASAVAAGDAWSDADCRIGTEGDCLRLATDFIRAMDNVRLKFAAWSPYL